ncbi:Uncharacterised protein [Streptomyces griseus]|uniref:Uncharacterized protein n=1 Tax=Streptomyces griseus TaxID=1911 RepID=A0A380MMY7_STRGR|nr:Uncharacterised protein [Streptomyces griseus]
MTAPSPRQPVRWLHIVAHTTHAAVCPLLDLEGNKAA